MSVRLRHVVLRLWHKALRHKVIALLIALAVFGGGYYVFGKVLGGKAETRYILTEVRRGTLTLSVSGTGQVSVSNQSDLKAKVSGDVVVIPVKEGEEVKAGALLVQLDARDAEKAVRDADVNLESAQIALQKLKQSTADTEKIKEDSFNGASNLMLDLPSIMTGLESVLYGTQIDLSGQWHIDYYRNAIPEYDRYKIEPLAKRADSDYKTARNEYEDILSLYKGTSRYADFDTVSHLLDVSVETSKSVSEALKSSQNLLDFFVDYKRNQFIPSITTSDQSRLKTYIGQLNGHLFTLINLQNTIKNTPLDISTQELTVKQRENALLDAEEKLADYFIRAPFGGVVADVPVKRGDSVSVGNVIATLITRQPVAEISLNEVDVAQVKIGQKATLTFDAVPDLKITGEVNEIDTLGTVSAGVVSYTVKVNFRVEDERVKPGMTVSADIVTEAKGDALLVPNSAVKSQGGASYVEVADVKLPEGALSRAQAAITLTSPPRRAPVEVGLSNEEFTEIISGLEEGQVVVAGTIGGQASLPTANSSQQNSGFRLPIPGAGRTR